MFDIDVQLEDASLERLLEALKREVTDKEPVPLQIDYQEQIEC